MKKLSPCTKELKINMERWYDAKSRFRGLQDGPQAEQGWIIWTYSNAGRFNPFTV